MPVQAAGTDFLQVALNQGSRKQDSAITVLPSSMLRAQQESRTGVAKSPRLHVPPLRFDTTFHCANLVVLFLWGSGHWWWRARSCVGLEAAAVSARAEDLLRAEGTAASARTWSFLSTKSLESLVALANQLRPDLTVVGPQVPLQLGVVDEFTRQGGRCSVHQSCCTLETSKSFAKEFMQRQRSQPPTTQFAVRLGVKSALSRFSGPVVVKADGLAAGERRHVKTKEEAAAAAGEMLSGKMVGEAGARVVLEECLQGDELSFLVLSDGRRRPSEVAARDHRRLATATPAQHRRHGRVFIFRTAR